MKNKKSKIIGIDVGGTKILLQTYDARWNVVDEEKVLTEVKKGQTGFLKQLISLIETYFHPHIKSIGIALPGIVDQKKGILIKAPHLPAKQLKLNEILERRFNCPIVIDNDGNAFLYAQSRRPQLKKYKNLIAVMPGTGLGGAMMVEGNLVYGKQGYAGEIGHMVLRADSHLNTFEKNASGAYVAKIAKELGIQGKFTTYHLAENSGEAKKVKNHLVHYLGLGLANLNLIFNPEAFVLGGSIYKYFLKDSKRDLKRIVAAHALDKKSPPIFDLDKKHTAALGVAMMSEKK